MRFIEWLIWIRRRKRLIAIKRHIEMAQSKYRLNNYPFAKIQPGYKKTPITLTKTGRESKCSRRVRNYCLLLWKIEDTKGINRRRTDNTMDKRKRATEQRKIYITQTNQNPGVNSDAPKWLGILRLENVFIMVLFIMTYIVIRQWWNWKNE